MNDENPKGKFIESTELIEEHIGSKVTYIPPHAKGNASHKDAEGGHIKRWNDKFCFVTFPHNTCACRFEDLVWG